MIALRNSRLLTLGALTLSPTVVQAHLVTARFGEFYSGLLHPTTALEHLIPWLALGLLAGLQEGKRARWLFLVFPLALLMGTGLAQIQPGLPQISDVNLASFVILGSLVVLAWRTSLYLLIALGALVGICHGYENGLAMTAGGNIILFMAGITAAGYVIFALATAVSFDVTHRYRWGLIAVRAGGSWITAIGIMMIGINFIPK